MTLGATGNTLSFWVKSINSLYGLEKYNVLVSTTNTATTSFTKLNPTVLVTSSVVEWNEKTFNLDAYAGQTIYIAIQCVSDDQFAFMVDDFKVTATTLATSDVNKAKASIYPNPTTDYLNLRSASKVSGIEIYDMSGKKINADLVDGKVDVQNLVKGSYVIKITDASGTTSQKFIKE